MCVLSITPEHVYGVNKTPRARSSVRKYEVDTRLAHYNNAVVVEYARVFRMEYTRAWALDGHAIGLREIMNTVSMMKKNENL